LLRIRRRVGRDARRGSRGVRESAEQRAALGVVALDERQHHQGGHRVGLGGLQNFDANLSTPQIVPHRLVYMSKEWQDAFRYAAELAQERNLQFAIASSPGWSETGGPWVKPEDGMKKLVWSEATLEGGTTFRGKLPPIPSATGPYQSMTGEIGFDAQFREGEPKPKPSFAADVAVLAYPLAEPPLEAAHVFVNDAPVDGAPLSDDRLDSAIEIPRGSAEKPGVLKLEYPKARTVRAVSFFMLGIQDGPFAGPTIKPRLEASDDGRNWHAVAQLNPQSIPTTVSFPPVTARAFRLVLAPPEQQGNPPGAPPGPPGVDVLGMLKVLLPAGLPAPAHSDAIADFRLYSEPKVHRFEEKAGFAIARDYFALDADAGPEVAGVAPERVVDLTTRLRPDGSLTWQAPKGHWRIVRFGYSLTGKTNHPATDEATGLEVDKLDAAAVRRYLETYLGKYRDTVGADLMGARGIRALVTDSTEVATFNWTPKFVEQFRRLRHYDPTPWLPTLAGTVIGSRKESDDFLYDFRRTLAELHASEHYATVAAVAHEQGLKVYGEALEDGRPSLGDDMAMRSYTDVPMSAMWSYARAIGPKPSYLADVKGAASVAHVYGQNLVAAESLTSIMAPWAFAPADLKPMMDLELILGVNRPVIHTSVHQPTDDKVPGLSLAVFGQYFNRHETWAEMARPWIDYIARSAYLLQQGRNVADVAYFYGEEAPLTGLYAEKPVADAPTAFAYDFMNVDALMNRLKVEQGDLVATGGARYRVLYLGGSSRKMTLPLLKRVAELAEAGATVVGEAPQGSPSLHEDTAEYRTLVKRLWSGTSVTSVGHGRVIASHDIESALHGIGVEPDFQYTAAGEDTEVLFLHRQLTDGDAYLLSNRRNHDARFEARFRVTGKAAQIWHADTGTIEPASYRIEGDHTVVPLEMTADEASFVVFREPAASPSLTVAKPTFTAVVELAGAWDVTFQSGRGAPPGAHLPSLAPLDQQKDSGVKYFSGVATYEKSFSFPQGVKPGSTLLLDLGQVGDVAEVFVNGQRIGIAWHAPYQLDIGQAVRPGRNSIEVRVANLWVNRLIGDAQPAAQKIAWTPTPTYRADATLRPSGLLGPVRLLRKDASAAQRR
jgi:hypothetical protein